MDIRRQKVKFTIWKQLLPIHMKIYISFYFY